MARLLSLALLALLVPRQVTRAIEIWSADPIAVEIQWITIDEAGVETITARRRTAVGPPVPLEFTHAAGRYVRFLYQGAAPRTFSTTELIAAKKLHVPDVLPGGELLLIVPEMAVRPVELRVEGPRVRTIRLDGVHASLSGVPPGDYRVLSVYDGGIKGAAQTATVRAEATTIALFPAEDVGAVRIVAPDDVCATATEMGINRLVTTAVGPNLRSAPNRTRIIDTREPRCDMTFGGLKPGEFEAFYRREMAQTGVGRFEILAQRISPVDVTAAPVIVEGRVTVNGRPLTGTDVTFFLRPAPGSGGQVLSQGAGKTDGSGAYRILLEEPGRYSVRMSRVHMGAPAANDAVLVEGRNMHDIALVGGTIKVDLRGWDRRGALQIRIQGPNGSMMMMSGFGGGGQRPAWAAGSSARSETPTWEALPWGEYKVSVTAGSRPVAPGAPFTGPDAKTAVLSPASPEVTLTFDVSKR